MRGDAPFPVRVPVDDTRQVTLVVTEGGNGRDCDHANWADAGFTMAADG